MHCPVQTLLNVLVAWFLGVFCPYIQHFCGSEACPMCEAWLLLAADLLQKCTCGREHGRPAQRTMSKVIFDGFPWVLDPSWAQSSQNGVPIVQLMILHEARERTRVRERAPRTGTSSAQLGPHLGPLSRRENRVFKT